MRTFAFIFLAFLALSAANRRADGVLQGKVRDESGEDLIGATVKIFQGGNVIRGVITDFEGNYRIVLPPGTYTVECLYTGYSTSRTENIQVPADKITTLDFTLTSTVLQEVVISEYKVPLIQQDAASSGMTITSQDIHNVGGGGSKPRKQEAARIKGSRSSPTNYYVDGIRVSGVAPAGATTQMERQGSAPRDSTAPEVSEEYYKRYSDNPFQAAGPNPVSTFSIDVDAAAYANMRRFINSGQLPPADAVRIEEMINYFDYQYAQPTDGSPFAVHTEYAACPWAPTHGLLLVGLQGQDVDMGQLPPSNFVFLVDVSGSMGQPDKLPLVQQTLELLTDRLRPQDRVALVVYAGAAGLVLPSTPGSDKTTIKDAIQNLSAGGSTAGGAGIQLAYKTARENFINGGNNRVVLCTDGDFNVGLSSEDELVKLIENERESGVFLTVLGYGTGNYQDGKMQQLADKGNGNHAYIDNIDEARKVLVKEFGGTLFAIAKDVKLQLDFNPDRVAGYRLIGYENRMLAKEDFDNDAKDAGELGAGHRVTALYEIIPAGGELPVVNADGKIVYQPTSANPAADDRLLTLKLRYKAPKIGAASRLVEFRIVDQINQTPSNNFQLAAGIAAFGMNLRNSPYKGNATYQSALNLVRAAAVYDPNGYRAELCRLIEKAEGIRG